MKMKYQTGCVYFLIKNKTFKQLILHVSTEINGFILINFKIDVLAGTRERKGIVYLYPV